MERSQISNFQSVIGHKGGKFGCFLCDLRASAPLREKRSPLVSCVAVKLGFWFSKRSQISNFQSEIERSRSAYLSAKVRGYYVAVGWSEVAKRYSSPRRIPLRHFSGGCFLCDLRASARPENSVSFSPGEKVAEGRRRMRGLFVCGPKSLLSGLCGSFRFVGVSASAVCGLLSAVY